MRGEHIDRVSLNTLGITHIFFKGVKVNEVSIRSIHEKAEKLLEDLGNLLPLATLSYLTKKFIQISENNNISQIPNKQTQSRSDCKNICSNVYVINYLVAITFLCATVSHNDLPPVGLYLWLVLLSIFLYLYYKLIQFGWVVLRTIDHLRY